MVVAAALVIASCDDGSTASRAPASSSSSKPTAPVSAGARTGDEMFTTPDGRVRTYHVYVPASTANAGRVPLLLALHGGGGSGTQFERNSGFDALADANHFVVVYPDGIQIGGASILANGHVWNGGRCCGPAAAKNVDDVSFLGGVIDRVVAHYSIDARRVYAAGHSNGAIMAYRLACELSTKIVAIGVQAGSLEVDGCHPARPVSVFHIHGTADRNIPIGGGRGTGISGVVFSPPQDAVGAFVGIDACPTPPTKQVSTANADVVTERWSPCADDTAVEFVAVTGASHAWMGHPSTRAAAGLTGAPYQKYDSSAAIWSFLAAHPRQG